MGKKGQLKIIIIVLIITTVLSTVFIFLMPTGEKQGTDSEEQIISNTTENSETENTPPETNLTTNTTQTTNQTDTNETTSNEIIPNPTGSIIIIDRKNSGGYYCNGSINPEHIIRLHTYKLINGVKTESRSYIESAKATSLCSTYSDYNESTGLSYEIEWQWEAVEGIDGYRIYLHYSLGDVIRDYEDSVDLTPVATRLLDTGLNLWG